MLGVRHLQPQGALRGAPPGGDRVRATGGIPQGQALADTAPALVERVCASRGNQEGQELSETKLPAFPTLDWVREAFAKQESYAYRGLPPILHEYVGSVRVYQVPPEFHSFLPAHDGLPNPAWSSFARVASEDQAWSETGLRRRVNRELAAQQAALARSVAPDSYTAPALEKPSADDPEGLVRVYRAALRNADASVQRLHTRELTGDPVLSPFILEGWWQNHQEHCRDCGKRGSWAQARLTNQHNPCYIADMLAILHHGWLIPFKKGDTPSPKRKANYNSLAASPVAVEKEWAKMVDNQVVIPAEQDHFICVSPLQAVIKPSDLDDALAELPRRGSTTAIDLDTDGYVDVLNAALRACGSPKEVKARLCVDLATTLNEHIVECPFTYPPVDNLLEHVAPGSWICKVDYRRCFFNIPLHPAMYPYFGIEYGGKLWQATRVLFGISLGPHVASMFTGETNQAFRASGVPSEVYIDDIAIPAATEAACYEGRETVLGLAKRAGWPVSEDKLAADAPAQRQAFRGVVFDTVRQQLTIPAAKLLATLRRIRACLDQAGSFQVRLAREVAGRLEWINQVLPLGRVRTKRLHQAIPRGAKNFWLMTLTPAAREDLTWWTGFLEEAIAEHGRVPWACFPCAPLSSLPVIRIFSDAAGELGFGAVMGSTAVVGIWKSAEAVVDKSSGWKELVPVLLILQLCAPQASSGSLVVVTTDNQGNAFSLNNATAASDDSFELLRLILEIAARHTLRVLGDWVPRDFNVLLDLCSRLCPLPGTGDALAHAPGATELPAASGGRTGSRGPDAALSPSL